MKIAPGEWKVVRIAPGAIFIVADINTVGLDWPLTILHGNKFYRFKSDELMQDWMIGVWSGHAKYVEVTR